MTSTHPIDSQQPDAPLLEQHLSVDLVLDDGERVPLPGRLIYDPREPYSVRLELSCFEGTNARWVFARDLLREGLHVASGAGAVRVWPPYGPHGNEIVHVLLSGPTAAVLLELPFGPLTAWLDRTWRAVPSGTEDRWLDWDATVDRLVGGR